MSLSPKFNHNDYLEFIDKFFKIRKKRPSSRSAFSADIIQKFVLNYKDKWVSHDYKRKKWPRTQDLKPLYVINSAAFLSLRDVYLKRKIDYVKNLFQLYREEIRVLI